MRAVRHLCLGGIGVMSAISVERDAIPVAW